MLRRGALKGCVSWTRCCAIPARGAWSLCRQPLRCWTRSAVMSRAARGPSAARWRWCKGFRRTSRGGSGAAFRVAGRAPLRPPRRPCSSSAPRRRLVVRDGAPTAFGRALCDELVRGLADAPSAAAAGARRAGPPALRPTLVPLAPSAPRLIELSAELSADERTLWWEALAHDAASHALPGDGGLDMLEGWWSAARSVPVGQVANAAPLSAEAERLARLRLSQRSWPASEAGRLGAAACLDELLERQVLAVDEHGWLVAGRGGVGIRRGAAPSEPSRGGKEGE